MPWQAITQSKPEDGARVRLYSPENRPLILPCVFEGGRFVLEAGRLGVLGAPVYWMSADEPLAEFPVCLGLINPEKEGFFT